MNPTNAAYEREKAAKKAVAIEAPFTARVANAALFADPQQYDQAAGETRAAMALMRRYPEITQKVMDILRQAGPLAAAAAAGTTVGIGPFQAHFKVGIEAYERAKISDKPEKEGQPSPRAIADKLTQHLAANAYYGMLARGINTADAGVGKMDKVMRQEAGINDTPASAYNALENNLNVFDRAKETYDLINKERALVRKDSLTPLADIFEYSDKLKVLNKKYQIKAENARKDFAGEKGNKP